MILGALDKEWGPISLPLALGGLGAPRCNLYASVDLLVLLATSATGGATLPISVPNISTLIGLNLYSQFVVLDGPANAAGRVTTNGIKWTFGDA